MSNESLDQQERELALEERKVDLENKKLQNAKLRKEQLEAAMAEENKVNQLRSKAQTLESQRPENQFKEIRKTCNHRMGGKGRQAFLAGRGNDDQSAVVKTKLPTGDVMIKCPRCRTVKLPAWDMDFYFDKEGKWLAKEEGGKFDKVRYQAAVDEYDEWYNFRTDLEMVVLPQYRWARGGKPINREVTYRYCVGEVSSPAMTYYENKRRAAKNQK